MKIELMTTQFELTPELEKYAHAKIARLVRKVPRSVRREAACIVTFSQIHKKGVEFNTCSISFAIEDTQLRAKEMTQHMYSSLDIAVVDIATQLKDYVATRPGRGIRGILRPLVR